MAVDTAAARALPLFLAVAVSVAALLRTGEASVHEYSGLSFLNKGNAFILHAGSEGLYAPVSPANATAEEEDDEAAAAAFIRYFVSRFLVPSGLLASSLQTAAV